eukprot:GFYU01003564.1.p2 GENE.GFYU01003564.1~~GFYU01003564.1.p2  ORF type:complete len:204 (-),score=67.65 GFYU01003564.1:70-681(-)
MGDMPMDTTMPMDMTMNNSTGGMAMGHSMSSGEHGAGHTAFFAVDYEGLHVLFEDWQMHDGGMYAGALIVTFILGLVFEFLQTAAVKYEVATATALPQNNYETAASENDSSDVESKKGSRHGMEKKLTVESVIEGQYTWQQQGVRTALYVLRTFVGYLLMLLFMTFNMGIAIMVMAGTGTGFLIFGRSKASIVVQQRHSSCGC